MARPEKRGLYLMHISVHGLLRGSELELGRDPDTGGQIKYVIELSRALAEDDSVEKIELLTRKVEGKGIDEIYRQPDEPLSKKASIVRLPCGPRRYLRKETLWPYLDNFVDHALHHIRGVGRIPDIIHGHYADGGYVGAQLARTLGVPFYFTGHSLGRVKRERMREKGASDESLEKKFHFSQRIEAEETALDTATQVVVSTSQEVEEQYALYDNYQPQRMRVIAPGVDLSRFAPPKSAIASEDSEAMKNHLERFLQYPERPMVLAIARPDERKNLSKLVEAFGEHPKLRDVANLVIVAGNRKDLRKLSPGARRVLRNVITLIDHYDLYGSAAYPKEHTSGDIPVLYRLAATTKGVFVNPALTEPFGLTLIEAAASGLPVVATDDGGPQDIIGSCENGVLIDPLSSQEIGCGYFRLSYKSWSLARSFGKRVEALS